MPNQVRDSPEARASYGRCLASEEFHTIAENDTLDPRVSKKSVYVLLTNNAPTHRLPPEATLVEPKDLPEGMPSETRVYEYQIGNGPILYIVFFPPNVTAHVQPMDQGTIHSYMSGRTGLKRGGSCSPGEKTTSCGGAPRRGYEASMRDGRRPTASAGKT